MFADLLKRLTAPEPARLPEPDAKLALAALLVRVARADDDYSDQEASQIDKVLAKRHGLSEVEATALRNQAESLEAEAPDTVRFTRAIKDAVAYEDRISVIEAMWHIVLADGVRDHEENTLMRLTANLLGVNDRDSNLARMRVQDRT